MAPKTYKGLLIERSMLLFIFDVGEPWLDTTGIAKQILFVDSILIGLDTYRPVSLGCLAVQCLPPLTIR